ncbi:MAG TPA: hypothetical protein PKV71_00175 [Calditrichia bacterium]|nr:hypothetical protein [Calditrichota bacterium]HQV30254.1 hypothetical protein [Calditrichia bacterium]
MNQEWSTENIDLILRYIEKKSAELDRAIWFPEALALWLSENPMDGKTAPAPVQQL